MIHLVFIFFFVLIQKRNKNPSISLRIKEKRMAPPVLPGQRHVTSKLFTKSAKKSIPFFSSFLNSCSSQFLQGGNSHLGKIKIEKYLGRSLFKKYQMWASIKLKTVFMIAYVYNIIISLYTNRQMV
jgi:hypothetical protein